MRRLSPICLLLVRSGRRRRAAAAAQHHLALRHGLLFVTQAFALLVPFFPVQILCGDAVEVASEAYYFSLDPPFIVNFTGKSRARFLQVSIEGLTRDATVKEDITKHLPQVRNNLVLLLSSKTYEELNTMEGKASLRKQVLKEITKILEAETGKEGVEDVFFTSFVMQ